MENSKSMYFKLAAQVADAVKLLIRAQQAGEEPYLHLQSEIETKTQKIPVKKTGI